MNTEILIVNDTADMGVHYSKVFEGLGWITNDLEILLDRPESVSLIVFTGGEDVNPNLYGEDEIDQCYCNPRRDKVEEAIFTIARRNEIPMFGICRGAQFLCVMSGGRMVQHCTGHHDEHFIQTDDGRRFAVSSSHHQMMIPSRTCPVIGWAEPRLSETYLGGKGKIDNYNREVEVVKFPSVRAIGVQFHPEVMPEDSDGYQYFQDLVKGLLK